MPDPAPDLDLCVYQGGYGSGKTFIGSFLGIELSEIYNQNRGLVVARTYPLVRDTTLQSYFDHFDRYGYVEGKDFHWKSSEAKLIFPRTGSTILFRHLENPFKLKSLTLGWIHIEEMSEIEEATFQMLLSRLRLTTVPRRRLFGTTNPQAEKGWIWKYFVNRKDSDARIKYRRVIAPSTENIHLPDTYIQNMKNEFDPEYYRINVLGEDGDYTSGLVCKNWSDANIEDTEYKPNLKIYLSCDFNVDPMCWVLAHRFNGEYHFFDELCLENHTTAQAVEVFARRYSDHRAGIVITGDASGQSRGTKAYDILETDYTIIRNSLSDLRFQGVHIDLPTKNPYIEDRVSAWNAMVCNTKGVRRIKVNPKCTYLISNCENLKYIDGSRVIWEPTLHQISQSRNLKFVKHPFDAASYLVYRYDPIKLEAHEQRKPRFTTTAFSVSNPLA